MRMKKYETLFSAVNQNESQNSENIYINLNLEYIFYSAFYCYSGDFEIFDIQWS